MKTDDIMALCMVVTVVSFMGFVVENIWLAVTKGYMDNRNMNFPFLLGYGVAMILIYMILGTPRSLRILGHNFEVESRSLCILTYFIGVMICICLGEILLGTFVEKTCHLVWWNYSQLPLHITKYTSIPTSSMFSVMVTAFMDFVFEKLFHYFREWDYGVLCVTACVMVGIMVWDLVYNALKMYKTQGMIRRWRIDVSNNYLYKRIRTKYI